jgi:hypothetical protein
VRPFGRTDGSKLSGMDAAQIEGHHLWREFLGAVDQFSMGRFALPTHVLFQNLLQTVAQQLDAVAQRTTFETWRGSNDEQ